MIYSSLVLANTLNVNSKNSKLALLEKKGDLVRLKKGLYSDNPVKDCLAAAAYIHNPSYISFEYALSYYGLIPERVVEITSATLFSEHILRYVNKLGRYSYRNVPQSAYSLDVTLIENDSPYYLATKEKALLDTLYIKGKCRSKKQITQLLFENLRIDEDEFFNMDFHKLLSLCDHYPGDTIRFFKLYAKEIIYESNFK